MTFDTDSASLLDRAAADGNEQIAVGAYVSDSSGRVLLLRRSRFEFLPGLLEIPSGAMEDGETVAQALVREVAEETGLSVTKIGRFVNHLDYDNDGGRRTRQLNFKVEVNDLAQVRLSDEHSEWLWMSADDVEAVGLDNAMRGLLIDYFAHPQSCRCL